MSSGVYHGFGTGQGGLLGREKEIDQIRRRWLKQHISIVAPRYYGKTVLMEHLAKVASEESGFAGVALWRVRKDPPKDDAAFWRKLCRYLNGQVPACREHLPQDEKTVDSELMFDAFKEMKEAGKRVLFLWDGVDELLLKGGLSDTLLDQLTALADLQCATLILTSRRRLMDLVPTEEARGSDFWRRFSTIIPLGCFQEADMPSLLGSLASEGVELDAGAQAALLSWSGGVPPLTDALLSAVRSGANGKCLLKKENIAAAAEKVDLGCISTVWRDLGSEIQRDLITLAHKDSMGGLSKDEMHHSSFMELQRRGLASERGERLYSTSQLLARHAAGLRDMPELNRHFGTSSKFLENIQALLELRLAQAIGLDGDLKHHVSEIIKDLHHPDVAMGSIRGVFVKAMELALKADFSGNSLPRDWVKDWESSGRLNRMDSRHSDFFAGKVPAARANKKWLYSQLLYDDKEKHPTRTALRAATIQLMDFIYEAANYGEHADEMNEKIPISFAISACSAAVELCHHLAEDLNNGRPTK